MFACSEGSLFAVKVHCSTEDPLSELSLIPSESPSSYYKLQLCQLIHSHHPFKLFLHLLLSEHIGSCVMFDLTASQSFENMKYIACPSQPDFLQFQAPHQRLLLSLSWLALGKGKLESDKEEFVDCQHVTFTVEHSCQMPKGGNESASCSSSSILVVCDWL